MCTLAWSRILIKSYSMSLLTFFHYILSISRNRENRYENMSLYSSTPWWLLIIFWLSPKIPTHLESLCSHCTGGRQQIYTQLLLSLATFKHQQNWAAYSQDRSTALSNVVCNVIVLGVKVCFNSTALLVLMVLSRFNIKENSKIWYNEYVNM